MQGQLLLGLQGLHFHIQTLDKVASGGGLSRVPETIYIVNRTCVASKNTPTIFKGEGP